MISIIKKLALSMVILFSIVNNSSAAYFPLEITNVKPAGTGNPAIASTNRIFRAYPGIEYNIRPAVVGGSYPFRFSLSNAPSGMTINRNTGEISWLNPQSSSGTITLTVTDAENSNATATWDVTVSTSGFIFVDSNYAGSTETGTITQPFKSIASLKTNTSSSNHTDIVYFRGGAYVFVPDDGQSHVDLSVGPFTWIGYPGETAIIDGNGNYGSFSDIYIDSINFTDFATHAVTYTNSTNYPTIRRCKFSDLINTDAENNNQGYIYSNNATSSNRHTFGVIQDNEFSNYSNAAGIGSLYASTKMLIEDNYIHDETCSISVSPCVGIAAKSGFIQMTIRHNKIIMNEGIPIGSSSNSQMADTQSAEMCFNYFKAPSPSSTAHSFNSFGYAGSASPANVIDKLVDGLYYRSTFNQYYYRNTTIGYISYEYLDGTTGCNTYGPFVMEKNVIINPNTDVAGYHRAHDFISYNWDYYPLTKSPWLCINDTDNLKSSDSAALDSSGLLANRSYVGTYGWEIPTASRHRIRSIVNQGE